MWRLTEEHLESIAIGAGILGTGGGGNPYVGMLRAREALRRYSPVDVLTPEELDEDARVVCVGGIGAPTVGIEKIRDIQAYHALRALEDYVGEKATALISNEMGGSNSLEPIIPASIAGLPIVDGDAMGRAFPELQMKTFFIYGVPWFPLALADEKGNSAIFPKAISAKWMERMARAVTIQMGCIACYALAPMSAEQIRRTAVPHTLTLALDLGNAVKDAQARHEDPIEAIMSVYPGRVLFQGKSSTWSDAPPPASPAAKSSSTALETTPRARCPSSFKTRTSSPPSTDRLSASCPTLSAWWTRSGASP